MYVQIEGGHVLRGELRLSGAKNAALPMLVGQPKSIRSNAGGMRLARIWNMHGGRL